MTTILIRRLGLPIFGFIVRWLALGLALTATAGIDSLPAAASEAPKDCGLRQYAALQVTYYDGWPEIPLLVDEHPVRMTLDTGSALSTIGQWAIQQLGLRVTRLPSVEMSVGSDRIDSYATIRDLALGNGRIKDSHIVVVPTHTSPTTVQWTIDRVPIGRLGMDLLSGVDVELDLAHDKVNLFSTDHCPGSVVYWADQYAVVPMRRGPLKDLYFSMELDGKKVQTKLATGDRYSVLSSYVTKGLYGWDESTAGLPTLPTDDGKSQHYKIMALTSGELQVLNTQVRLFRDPSGCIVAARVARDADGAVGFEGCENVYPLRLGMNVLKKLRLYLATREQKLYFTLADAHKSSDPARIQK